VRLVCLEERLEQWIHVADARSDQRVGLEGKARILASTGPRGADGEPFVLL
jgi:hypothetical protein